MNSIARVSFFCLFVALVGSLSGQSENPRITKGSLLEEQRVTEVRIDQARGDLDRAKVDLNGKRMTTAEVVLARAEMALSRAGGLLQDHPVRIAKLKGLFISQKTRDELMESYRPIYRRYADLEREYYTMIDEIGTGLTSRNRMKFLKFVSSVLPELEEANPEMAAKFEALLSQYEDCVERGDDDCARETLEELAAFYEANKQEIEKITDKKTTVGEIVSEPAPDPRAYSTYLQQIVSAIEAHPQRAQLTELYNQYLAAVKAGDMAKAAQLLQQIQTILGPSAPTPPEGDPSRLDPSTLVSTIPGPIAAPAAPSTPTTPPPAPAAPTPPPANSLKGGALQELIRPGETILDGENRLPRSEYEGQKGGRIKREFDLVVIVDEAQGTYDVKIEQDQPWALEIIENYDDQQFDEVIITSFSLSDAAGGPTNKLQVQGWEVRDQGGTVLRQAAGDARFKVEFSAAGNYTIEVSGVTDRGNPFAITRGYVVEEGDLY